ncbi:MAG: hypothetical protein IJK59_04525, partial [Firmicutes bacterium]|nr:hypothetical protein [Bacillota bacterium]
AICDDNEEWLLEVMPRFELKEQEMKSIRGSEEYKAAKKRRNEMQSRVDSWKKQMRAAVKTK